MSEWVSVNDEMPPDSQRPILAVYESAYRTYREGDRRKNRTVIPVVYAGGAWRFILKKHQNRYPDRITHWMYFPKPPKIEYGQEKTED